MGEELSVLLIFDALRHSIELLFVNQCCGGGA